MSQSAVNDEIPDHLMNPRCRRKRPFLLFHWSPSSRRKSIKRNGLRVGSRHAVHSKGWRAPYMCFSDSPSFGWAYSADTTDTPQSWDLWMVWSSDIQRLTWRFDHKGQTPAEFRAWHDVPASKMWMVGTREHKP